MQVLFQIDQNKGNAGDVLELFCRHFEISKKFRPFLCRLVQGVTTCRPEIDSLIERFSQHWKMTRMSRVDRNVMRIAVYELLYCRDIPPKVSINEAIDIGKKFGTEDSGAFINGILDSIRLFLEKENRLDGKVQDSA